MKSIARLADGYSWPMGLKSLLVPTITGDLPDFTVQPCSQLSLESTRTGRPLMEMSWKLRTIHDLHPCSKVRAVSGSV